MDQVNNTCSKCEEPSERALLVPQTNGVRIVRLCKGHWTEVEALLPAD